MTVFMSESLINSTVSTKKHKFIQDWSAVVGSGAFSAGPLQNKIEWNMFLLII